MEAQPERGSADEPAWSAFDALVELLGPWNVRVAGLDTAASDAPVQPGLDGLMLGDVSAPRAARELLIRTREALGFQNDVPVIVLTRSDAAERRAEFLQAGADDCMSMPSRQGSFGRASPAWCKPAAECASCKRSGPTARARPAAVGAGVRRLAGAAP